MNGFLVIEVTIKLIFNCNNIAVNNKYTYFLGKINQLPDSADKNQYLYKLYLKIQT